MEEISYRSWGIILYGVDEQKRSEIMDKKEKAKEKREKRRQEISLLRTIPYSDHQR